MSGDGERDRRRHPPSSGPSLRLSIALVLVAAVLLSTAVAAVLSRWWVERDIGLLLEKIGWQPAAGRPMIRARWMADLLATTGFGRRLTDSILISGAAGALVAGLIGYAGATRLARPLTRLSRRVRRLAAGDYGEAPRELRGGEARPTGTAGFSADGVREVVEIQSAVESLSGQLQAAELLRRRLVEDLVHELRSPLTAVRGYAEGIRDGVFPEPAQASAGMERELTRIERLLADLRYSASPALPGSLAPVDLTELVHMVAEGFAAQAIEHEVSISAGRGPGHDGLAVLPSPGGGGRTAARRPMVLGDADRLGQVVSNLLDNALKFTPAGGRITVTVQDAPDRPGDRDEIQLTVQDTGPGISAADLPHVFDRLYRADQSRARSTGGSGIGLAIVRQIVLNHGGTVEARNTPGSGAMIVVRLPRARATV